MKNNIGFFTHEIAAPDNRKFVTLRAYYGGEKGWAMEAKFWAVNCKIGDADGCMLDTKLKGMKPTLARFLEMSLADLDDFLRVLEVEAELLHNENGVIWTQQTQDDLKRAMAVRIEAQNRRNGKVVRQLDDESKTSADDSNSSADKNHGAEQSRADRSRAEQACRSSLHEDSEIPGVPDASMPPAACPFITTQEVKSACSSAPFQIRLSARDLEDIAAHLSGECLGPEYIAYVINRTIEATPKNPGAFCRSALLGTEAFSQMPDEYRADSVPVKRAEPQRDPPPLCDECGGELREIPTEGQAFCPKCRGIWAWDEDFRYWAKQDERALGLSDVAGAFREKMEGLEKTG